MGGDRLHRLVALFVTGAVAVVMIGCASDKEPTASVDPDHSTPTASVDPDPSNLTARYDLVKNVPGVDGFYLDDSGKMVVLTKSSSGAQAVRDQGMTAKRVTMGESDLSAINARITRELIAEPDATVLISGVDLAAGVVVVHVAEGARTPYVQTLSKRAGVRVEASSTTPSPAV